MVDQEQHAVLSGVETREEWASPVLTTFDAREAEGGDTINSDGVFTS